MIKMKQLAIYLPVTMLVFLFSVESNAFGGIPTLDGFVDDGVEFKIAFPPLGSVERNDVDYYWQGSRENEISKENYESYVDKKAEDLQKGDPQAFKTYANAPVREIKSETKVKLGWDVGLMSIYRKWSSTNETIIDADQAAYFKLQEQGYDPLPSYLRWPLESSITTNVNTCTEFNYVSLSADSLLCN